MVSGKPDREAFWLRNKIRALREERHMTQKELGAAVGVSRQAINAVETGKFDPSIWLAHDLARFFGTTIEDIFIYEEDGI